MRAAKSPLVLNLKPSKSLLVFQLLMAATAIVHLTLLPIETWPRLLALVLAVAWVLLVLRCWRRSQPQTMCFYPSSGHWQIDGGLWLQPEPNQFVTRALVILYFRDTRGRRLSRVIPRDSLSPEQHRQLRQLLLLPAISSGRDG
ncbi:hypothetical protein N9B92_00560 [Porticoccaceae bacterium]|nr:hypothetical protein [Porticoccaceae bacterium]